MLLQVDDKKHDVAAIFSLFTDLVEKLVKGTQSGIRLLSSSNLWREMGAAVQLLSASEPMISLMTLTRTFFRCTYSKEEIIQYVNTCSSKHVLGLTQNENKVYCFVPFV